MSQEAYLVAVRDKLRTALTLSDAECDVHMDGNVPIISGKRYFGVLPGSSVDIGGADYAVHEEIGVDVQITLRGTFVPQDAKGRELLIQAVKGLGPIARDIAYGTVALHMNYALMAVVNAAIAVGSPSAEGFYFPLRCLDLGTPGVVDGTVFGGSVDAAAGVRRALRFGQAKRMQAVSAMAA